MSSNPKSPGSARSVIRRGRMRADHFVQVSNDLARDRRLTRKARGLFVELASHVEGWMTSIAQLAQLGPEGVHAIRGAVEELEKYGYLVRVQNRDPATGRLGETEYWITDCPEEYEEASSEPSLEDHTTGRGERSSWSEPSCDFPTSAEPHADQPCAEDCTHKKTNPKKTNKRNQEMPPSSASPAGDTQQEIRLGDDTAPPPAKAKKPRSRSTKRRTPEEQLRFEQATKVADWWWGKCDEAGVPKIGKSASSNGFPGLVKLIESALADDYTQKEVAYALGRNPTRRFPSLQTFETALMAVRGIVPQQPTSGQQRVATSDLRVSQVQSMMADYAQAQAEGRLEEWFATPETLSDHGRPAASGSASLPGGTR
ncbi:hypothetical protein [Nonomuraea sp. NPDC003754]